MSTDVTTTEQKQPPTLAESLQAMRPEIERALPKHMSGDRLTRIVLTELRKTPRLAQCTPQSFFGALMTAAALGVEPGVSGECYLIPFRDKRSGTVECQFILGYQGLAKLFWQHPLAKRLSAEYVCENDHFAYDKGLTLRLEHTPAQGDRGKVIGYYAIVELSTGGIQFDYFTAEEIRAIRGGREGTSGDIADLQHWMERKTALKQVLKLMPKSAELATALRADESIGSMQAGQAIAAGEALPELTYREAHE